jgi:hypothetical protein
VPGRQVRQRSVLQVGNDLLDDRVRPVGLLGLEHRQRAVGEHRVVAVGGEQLALVVGVHVLDPAHDQPGVNVLGLGRERGVADLGDFSVANPLLAVLVEDRVGVLDGRPGVLGDAGDRLAYGPALSWLAVMENRARCRRAAAIASWP